MALDFPNSPSVNDSFSAGGKTWVYNGTKWVLLGVSLNQAVADGAITTAKIADSAITASKIADGTIVAAEIANNAVTTAKILDANVTQAKLGTTLSAVTVTTAANRDTAVASPFTGQLVFLTDTKKIQVWDGTSWLNITLAPPETPTSLSATALSGTSISIAFTAGGANGSPITNYKYALSTDSGSTYGSFTALSPEDITTPITISGLSIGVAYYIKLKAVNDMGDSVASAAVSISTLSTPLAPTSLSAGSITATTADIAFTAGNQGGSAITNYQYALSTDSGSTYGSFTALSPADATTPITITGLSADTAYYVKLKAVNTQGVGLESSAVSFTTLAQFSVDYLVVAGAGGGGSAGGGGGGGGGAGGLRSTVTATGGGGTLETALTVVSSTNYTATVGNGGSGGSGVSGSNGGNSVFSTITSLGGGGGAYSGIGTSGGSGGGNGHYEVSASGGAGTANQGFAGGRANTDAASYGIGGGGGGAGSAGVGGAGGVAGAGGAGVSVSMVTSTPVTYASGGGAGSDHRSPAGAYAGGGGAGVVGTVNRGMGGGGGSYTSPSAGAAGGSGIVILRYPVARTITIGAGLTGTTATDGSFKVTTLTAGTGDVSWA